MEIAAMEAVIMKSNAPPAILSSRKSLVYSRINYFFLPKEIINCAEEDGKNGCNYKAETPKHV